MLWKVTCDGSVLSSPMLIDTVVLCATLRGEFFGVELVSFDKHFLSRFV